MNEESPTATPEAAGSANVAASDRSATTDSPEASSQPAEAQPTSSILSPVELRILGCLVEKERTTPEVYPLTLNSLTNACNQTSNRDPVVFYDQRVVEHGLEHLRAKKLVCLSRGTGSRVQKFRHAILEQYDLNPGELALLCVSMLRGAQTLGELRTRTERLHFFKDMGEAETALRSLCQGSAPLVRLLPAGPGQKEKRYAQLLSGEPENSATTQAPEKAKPATVLVGESRLAEIEARVTSLRQDLDALRQEFDRFKKQFE